MIIEAVVAAVVTVIVGLLSVFPALPAGPVMQSPGIGQALVLANMFLPVSEIIKALGFLMTTLSVWATAWGLWATLRIIRGM